MMARKNIFIPSMLLRNGPVTIGANILSSLFYIKLMTLHIQHFSTLQSLKVIIAQKTNQWYAFKGVSIPYANQQHG